MAHYQSPPPPLSPPPKKNEITQFPIVGIGASAGGLEALELFFENMPKDNGMAFVVIQHLDPNYIGMIPELLQRRTPMKVFQASDNLKVKPNCVYVIPPNKSLSLLNGTLHLFDPVESCGLRLPIDIFFRSMADDRQDKSIGIILSGMGSDGSLGLKAIKEKNGIVLVQSPASAKFNGMPASAIEAVIADMVAPVEELPAKLIHELQAYQIELELLNEELILARSNVQKITEKYTELYDLAPSGYFTLENKGNILECNLCGSQMLGKERSQLKSSRFSLFLSLETRPIFNLFLDKIFQSRSKETCEVKLLANGAVPTYVLLTGIITENQEQCNITMVDITRGKQLEEALRISNEFNQSLLKTIPFGMDIVDENGNILYWGMHVSHVKYISKFAGYENPGQSIGI